MVKFFALLLAAVGLSLCGLGLALARENPAMLALVIVGAAIVYFAYTMDNRRENTSAQQHKNRIKLRIEALAKMPWEKGNALTVRVGNSNLLIASLIFVTGILLAYSSASSTEPRWGMFAGSILFSAVALFALMRILPFMGKPTLTLNIRGFQTPLYGFVPWSDVGGINLQQIAIQGSQTNTLIFQVENYANDVFCTHWTEKVLAVFGLGALRRKVISVVLNGASEDPEAVYATARLLWQKNTGMTHNWNPMLSHEFNQAARRAHKFMDRYKDPHASIEVIERDPDKVQKEIEQFRQDMNTVNTERRRTTRQLNWLMAICILGIIASVLWSFLRNLV